MSVMIIVLPIALLLAGASVWACIWAVRTGQYDDTDTPALRMLRDDRAGKQPGPESTGPGVKS